MKKLFLNTIIISCGLTAAQLGFAANCTGAINNNAVSNLTVPAGATCTLNSSSVDGNVNVQNGASLILNNSSVSGSVQANSAKVLKLVNSSVEGMWLHLKFQRH